MTQQKKPKSEDPRPSGRRQFLKLSALTGAAAVMGSIPGVGRAQEAEAEAEAEAEDGSSSETVHLLNQDGELVEVRVADILIGKGELVTDRQEVSRGVEGRSFVMVIDLGACRNARRCVEDCQAAHNLRPDQEYVDVKKMQDSELADPYWMPQLCFHCDNPPCTKVCPVDATWKRADGIVAIDNEICIGCRFCMVACPYSARVFNWNEPQAMEVTPPYSPETSLPKARGTVDKCDFCPDMARAGELPHCVTACPNNVFYFGDLNEDAVSNGVVTVRLSELLAEKGGYRYMEELGTEPRVYYLPPRDRAFPFEQGLENYEKAVERVRDYRLEGSSCGRHSQTHDGEN
ncbi:MAG: 4Fe-4S dicluster domain-containing protein [Bradymonadaceae bacterium]